MNNWIISNGLRIVFYILLQVLVLKEITLGGEQQPLIFIFIYPLVLVILPIRIPQFFVLFLAFAVGLIIDLFYLSPGVHAGACLWMTLFRPLALRIFEPKNGYLTDAEPTIGDMGVIWFSQYAGSLLFIFFISYFSLQIFTFVYTAEILIKAVLSFLVSGIIIFLMQLFFSFKS